MPPLLFSVQELCEERDVVVCELKWFDVCIGFMFCRSCKVSQTKTYLRTLDWPWIYQNTFLITNKFAPPLKKWALLCMNLLNQKQLTEELAVVCCLIIKWWFVKGALIPFKCYLSVCVSKLKFGQFLQRGILVARGWGCENFIAVQASLRII